MKVKLIVILFVFFSTSKFLLSQEISWQALMDSSSYYQEKQNFQTALHWSEKAVAQAKMEFGEKDTNYIASLTSIYICYYYLGNYEKSIEYCEITKPIIKELRGEKSFEYAETVGNLGFFYNQIANYTKAEPLLKEAMDLNRRLFKVDHQNLAICINNMALFLEGRGRFIEAELLYEEALKMSRRLFNGDHQLLATTINSMATFYDGRGRNTEAEPLYKEAMEMYRRLFKGDHPYLANSINNLAVFYHDKGRFAEAENLYKESLQMYRRLFIGDHPDLATTINSIASFYNGMGRYAEAEPLYKEGLDMSRRLFKGDHPDLGTSINNLGHFYEVMGRYAEAEPLFKEAFEMRKRIFNGDHLYIAQSINNMAGFYSARGRFTEAEPLYKKALEMYRRLFIGDHPDLANSINNIAGFYNERGQYAEAELLYKEALEMYRRLFKGDHPDLANSINNTAMFCNSRGDYTEAELLCKEALDMRRRIFKGEHPDLAVSINNMAMFYNDRGRFTEAEPLYIEALEMRKHLFKGDHPYLANSINNMAYFYNGRGRIAEAEQLYIKALEMRRRLFIDDHPDLANSVDNLAYFYNSLGRYDDAEPLYLELMTVCNNIMNYYFPSLSEKEKEQYFHTFSKYYLQFNNFVVSRYIESPKLLENMFNNQLLTKAMLLSASNKVRSRILSSNDTSLIELFSSWKDKKEYIAKLYQLSKVQLEKKNINLDSIIKSANEQEKELTKSSEVFKKEYDKQKLTWKDVQNSLGKDEAVVEIARFNFIDKSRRTDTVYYATFIVKKNSKVPELVLLKNGKVMENDYISNYYKSIQNQIDDNSSYEQFWKPISAKLIGIKKVYISSDGVYNQINLATLKNPKTGKYLFDEKDIVLLSSSRDLVDSKMDSRFHMNDTNLVVELFGDPLFNLDNTTHLEFDSAVTENKKRDFYYLGNTLDSTTRGGIRPIPATRTEIEQIANEFTNKGWKVNSHLGEKALEEAVKRVDNPKVLHIATHGKFLKDVEVKDDDRMLGMEKKRVAENPLLRSFLLFSGAENTLNNQKLDDQNTDDGLLTAYEAMNLNLENTDLVVLSACETGLGEIRNGEGVYGLQRAFQQAGARSIIMSLWTVPDKETQELMTSFYSKWLNGMDKRTAFNVARNEMRNKYNYSYYWGGFVMVGE